MFKELKKISVDSNQIKNQLELQRIASVSRIDRTESCFAGKSHQTMQQYYKSAERAAKSANKWF